MSVTTTDGLATSVAKTFRVTVTPLTATLPFTDDFNRANSSFISPYWTTQAGSLALVNNAVVTTGAAASVLTVNGISAADVSVSAVINTSTSPAVGLVARYTGTGDNGMYYGTIVRNATGYVGSIWKNVNNTWSQIASQTAASGVGVLRFDVIGSNLSLWLNNQQVVSVVDVSITGPGTAGIRFYGGGGGLVDSFSVNPLRA